MLHQLSTFKASSSSNEGEQEDVALQNSQQHRISVQRGAYLALELRVADVRRGAQASGSGGTLLRRNLSCLCLRELVA